MKLSIPIMIDSKKDYESFKMTRCTYYSVSSSLFAPIRRLRFSLFGLPIYVIGWEGILYKPLGLKKHFSTPESIDKLFDLIESHEEQIVETNDLWIPNFMFANVDKRGSVYRISKEVFILANNHRHDKISNEDYIEKLKVLNQPLFYSESETIAFRKWQDNIIDQVKINYTNKATSDKLRWQE